MLVEEERLFRVRDVIEKIVISRSRLYRLVTAQQGQRLESEVYPEEQRAGYDHAEGYGAGQRLPGHP
ncbi:MAG: hypothetical protein F4X65_05480 [Chloroflexi bacterium]|nr:hypothetical protein [Chloroflexota bacterium]